MAPVRTVGPFWPGDSPFRTACVCVCGEGGGEFVSCVQGQGLGARPPCLSDLGLLVGFGPPGFILLVGFNGALPAVSVFDIVYN